ncbi:MAG: hypothetical protein V3V85_04160 [Candidatus Thorarchaeota archaeon]
MTETAPQLEEGQASAAPESNEGQATQTPETPVPVDKFWYDGANDETVGYIQNKGWTDSPMKALEAYQNLEKFHGVPADKIIKIPGEGESMDAVYDKLGRPEAADKYEIALPEGVSLDTNRMKAMSETAHKMGLNNAQLQALAEVDATYMASAVAAHNEELALKQEAEYGDLKKEWGVNSAEREELGRRFLRDNLPQGVDKDALVSKIEEAVGTAVTLKLFANAGNAHREDNVPDSSGDRPFGYTREQAAADRKTLMSEMQGDPSRLDSYNKGIGPDIEKMKSLNKVIAG